MIIITFKQKYSNFVKVSFAFVTYMVTHRKKPTAIIEVIYKTAIKRKLNPVALYVFIKKRY